MKIASVRERLAARGILPGALPLEEAAAYVGLSVNTFLVEVAAGTMPAPLPLKARRKLYAPCRSGSSLSRRQEAA